MAPAAARVLPGAALLLILLLAATLKSAYGPQPIRPGEWDGNFYLQVAQHVAAGDGLVTSASIHSRGFGQLPHASLVYPLWPWLLGHSGRVLGLERAASWLPEVLYLVSLLLLYFLTNAMARGWARGTVAPFPRLGFLRPGHAVVLVLALHPVYFEYTSLPYTEGLSYSLGFAALLAAAYAVGGRGPLRWGLLAGVLAGLAYLARYQMAAVALAIPLSLAPFLRSRSEARAVALASCVGAASVVLPWWLHLLSVMRAVSLRPLFDISAYQEDPMLLAPDKHVVHASFVEFAADRLTGLTLAFDPTAPVSYVASFGPIVYLVPAAGLHVLWRLLRRRSGPVLTRFPDSVPLLAGIACAAICLLPVHLTHWKGPSEWWFHDRHGLPMILLVAAALAYFVVRSFPWRLLALLAFGVSVALGALAVQRLVSQPYSRAPDAATQQLVAWIQAQDPAPLSLTTQPRYLAVLSDAGFHQISCSSPPAQTRLMLDRLPIDYVIVYWGEWKCSYLQGLGVKGPRALLEPVRRFGQGRWQIEVLRPRARPRGDPASAERGGRGRGRLPALGTDDER
jgi:hypothetical protein